MKYKKILTGLLILVFVLTGTYYFYNLKNKRTLANSDSPSYQVKVRRGNITLSVKGSGQVQPYNLYIVYTKSSGTIEKLYVKEGDTVKKGDLLFEVSNEDVDLALKKAELNLKQQQLSVNDLLSSEEKKEVKSPQEGYVKEVLVQIGDQVNKGTTLARIITNPDKSIIKAPFNGNQIKNIKVGQKAEVFFTDSLFNAVGKVKSIDSKGELQSNGAVFYYATILIDGDYYIEGQKTPAIVSVYTDKGVEKSIEVGYIEAPETIDIKADISGYISNIFTSEKRKISKGEKLFTINSEDLDKQKENALLSLKQAELDYQQKLLQKEDLIYKAPIDGQIIELNIKEGDELAQGTNANSSTSTSGLLTIADFSKIKVVIPVDELDVVKIKPGLSANITFDSLGNRVINGIVEKVSNVGTVKNDVTTYDVTIIADNVNGIKSGMNANVEIIIDKKENVLLIPQMAIRNINGRYFVNVPGDNSDKDIKNGQNKGNMKEIKIGISNNNFVEVLEGLHEGDTVLIFANSNSQNNNSFGQYRRMNQMPIIGPPAGPRG